ncbi:MAG: long-chain fatty acid--CoA ligase, partial [bacterium]|nr:long-chain fatty acid--CoA ligase [bacterium]
FETIKDLISSIETKQPQLDAMLIKEGDSYQNITYKNLTDSVKKLANGLINMGIEKGDKIAIMAENRMEWSIVYLAVTTIGAIIIPISILWEPTELKTVAQNSGIKMFFTSEKYLDKIATIKKETLTLKQIVTFDAHPLTETNNNTPLTEQEYIPYPEIIQSGTDSLKQNIDHTQNITINPKDTAEILYVSCKIGVTLSHKAIMSNVEGLYKTLKLAKSPGKKLMMLIPFSHLYPTIFGILMTLRAQWTTVTAATARMDHILKIVKETAPHYIVLVPLLLERMYNRLNARIKKRNPTPEMLGTQNLEAVFVAGAKCPESFIEGLESLGLKVLEGYGLSEMAPFITMNTLEKNQTGSVGIPLENVVVKIANPDANGNGEVLAKGPNMMCGYHKLQQEGKLQIKAEGGAYIDEEGWLHTGDIGKLLNADGTTVTTPIA